MLGDLKLPESVEGPPWLLPRAAYIHVPFCAHHCCYCDFAVAAGKDALIDRYLDALEQELATLREPQQVKTLFIGGGTPTHLPPIALARLLEMIQHWLPPDQEYEFSVEANPATLTAEKVDVLAQHGVNRLSLGVQSFQSNSLRVLERDHRSDDVCRAIDCVRTRISNVSLDLIFGVPGQTVDDFMLDLTTAVSLGIEHISTYGLTYEKGTPLWKNRERGKIKALDEDTELEMYVDAMEYLEVAGLAQYEISSFSRTGKRCRHNENYWANYAHFGFGLGAARYVQGRREVNTRDLGNYIKNVLSGEPATMQSEVLVDEERARETMTLNLRRVEGIRRDEFRRQTGFEIDRLAGEIMERHVKDGLLVDDGKSIRLTRKGRCLADSVMTSLL